MPKITQFDHAFCTKSFYKARGDNWRDLARREIEIAKSMARQWAREAKRLKTLLGDLDSEDS